MSTGSPKPLHGDDRFILPLPEGLERPHEPDADCRSGLCTEYDPVYRRECVLFHLVEAVSARRTDHWDDQEWAYFNSVLPFRFRRCTKECYLTAALKPFSVGGCLVCGLSESLVRAPVGAVSAAAAASASFTEDAEIKELIRSGYASDPYYHPATGVELIDVYRPNFADPSARGELIQVGCYRDPSRPASNPRRYIIKDEFGTDDPNTREYNAQLRALETAIDYQFITRRTNEHDILKMLEDPSFNRFTTAVVNTDRSINNSAVSSYTERVVARLPDVVLRYIVSALAYAETAPLPENCDVPDSPSDLLGRESIFIPLVNAAVLAHTDTLRDGIRNHVNYIVWSKFEELVKADKTVRYDRFAGLLSERVDYKCPTGTWVHLIMPCLLQVIWEQNGFVLPPSRALSKLLFSVMGSRVVGATPQSGRSAREKLQHAKAVAAAAATAADSSSSSSAAAAAASASASASAPEQLVTKDKDGYDLVWMDDDRPDEDTPVPLYRSEKEMELKESKIEKDRKAREDALRIGPRAAVWDLEQAKAEFTRRTERSSKYHLYNETILALSAYHRRLIEDQKDICWPQRHSLARRYEGTALSHARYFAAVHVRALEARIGTLSESLVLSTHPSPLKRKRGNSREDAFSAALEERERVAARQKREAQQTRDRQELEACQAALRFVQKPRDVAGRTFYECVVHSIAHIRRLSDKVMYTIIESWVVAAIDNGVRAVFNAQKGCRDLSDYLPKHKRKDGTPARFEWMHCTQAAIGSVMGEEPNSHRKDEMWRSLGYCLNLAQFLYDRIDPVARAFRSKQNSSLTENLWLTILNPAMAIARDRFLHKHKNKASVSADACEAMISDVFETSTLAFCALLAEFTPNASTANDPLHFYRLRHSWELKLYSGSHWTVFSLALLAHFRQSGRIRPLLLTSPVLASLAELF